MMRLFLFGLVALVGLVGVRWFVGFTPPIFKKNSVTILEAADINGVDQHLLIRGNDRSNPVILFLHGGPGMPSMFLAHAFQRPLEENFVVVHWDQRGAGKSFSTRTNPELISTSQLISDAEAVIEYLRGKLGADRKVFLVGHSHGSYLGAIFANRRPDLVEAYIGLGQVADVSREIGIQDEFLRRQLSDLGLPADTEISGANREDLLFKTGSEIYGETSFIPLILEGLKAPEYSLSDVMKVSKGSSFSSENFKRDMIDGPLMAAVTSFEIPVVIAMGDHDMVTPVSLAREYFDVLEAPQKCWVSFEKTAHFPHYEEPDQFSAVMNRILDGNFSDCEMAAG